MNKERELGMGQFMKGLNYLLKDFVLRTIKDSLKSFGRETA